MHDSSKMPLPSKRLVIFFDGTWNEPGDNTNVWRLYLMLSESGADQLPQLRFYDQGVGTRWYDRITGGAFGAGLSQNVCKAYCWLMEHYSPGDEIYLFGFSRGAFTARSLAGLIARCGLLGADSPISFTQLFERYQRGDAARPIYELIADKKNASKFEFEDRALLEHSHYRRNLIKMVGVWDTVGSIGLPFGNIKGISGRTLRFHNTRLSKVIQHSYQALALDEYRKPYWAILWTDFFPTEPDLQTTAAADTRYVEQRWFSGAHANIGGGYKNDPLPQRPLAWMQQKAHALGLNFKTFVKISDTELEKPPTDSYREFLAGYYKHVPFAKRYVRWVMSDPVPKVSATQVGQAPVTGVVKTINERIDRSVFERCQRLPDYRPAGLLEWAKRRRLNLEDVITHIDRYPRLYADVTTPGLEIPN